MELHKHFKLNSMLRYISVILFIVSATVNADIQTKYDQEEGKLVFFDVVDTKEFTLKCGTSDKLHWTKDGHELSSIPNFKDKDGVRYEIKANNDLVIRRLEFSDDGLYTCTNPQTKESAEYNVVANVYISKFVDNLSVVEGEKLKIHCKVLGTNPKIEWSVAIEQDQEKLKDQTDPLPVKGGNDDNKKLYVPLNDTRVTYEALDNVLKGTLILNGTQLRDRGMYNCTATNDATGRFRKEAEQKGCYVRVKERLAALWPFLGICAEVLILCAIILVYEKRRNKEGLDESDTDQSPEQEKLKTGK